MFKISFYRFCAIVSDLINTYSQAKIIKFIKSHFDSVKNLPNMLVVVLIFVSVFGQLAISHNIFNTSLSVLLPFYKLPPLQDVEISAPLEAFIITTAQEDLKNKLTLPIYAYGGLDSEQFRQGFSNWAYKGAVKLGSQSPELIAGGVLQDSLKFSPMYAYQNTVIVGSYAIGKLLEDKGLLTDVSTAIKKAKDYIQSLQRYLGDLPDGSPWNDYFVAMEKGTTQFILQNMVPLPGDIRLTYDRFAYNIQNCQ